MKVKVKRENVKMKESSPIIHKNLQIPSLIHFHSILKQVAFVVIVYLVNLNYCQSFLDQNFKTSIFSPTVVGWVWSSSWSLHILPRWVLGGSSDWSIDPALWLLAMQQCVLPEKQVWLCFWFQQSIKLPRVLSCKGHRGQSCSFHRLFWSLLDISKMNFACCRCPEE